MPRLLLRLLSLLAVLVSSTVLAHDRPVGPTVRVAYLFSDGNIPGTLKAFETLLSERPDLVGKVELTLVSESTKDQTPVADLRASDVLIFDMMNEQMLAGLDAETGSDTLSETAKAGVVLAVGQGLLPQDSYVQKGAILDPRAQAYWIHSGPQNQLNLLKLALTKAGIAGLEPSDPQVSLDFGYYYPDSAEGRVFASWDEFDSWRAAAGKKRPGAPRIAVGFFKASYYSGDMAHLDALIREIERQGGEAIPVFGYPGPIALQHLLLDEDGVARADAALGANFQFADALSGKVMETLNIPVMNLITLYGRSEAEWRASAQGLSAFEGTFSLAVPELAGTVSPTVIGTKERVIDPRTGMTSVMTSPVADRVKTAVARAMRYAQLRLKPNAEKRIALLYYNYPAGRASIGASYLNVAESLANVLQRLQAEGYDLGGGAPSADQILADITSKARNVSSDAPGELSALIAAGGTERIPLATYQVWLDALPALLRSSILKDWGSPEQSQVMRQGTDFIIPAVRYGKVLLTPQPSRGWGEDLEKLYHAKDLAPPHQYVAAYSWLRNGYGADALVHVGTHGTLEWLDGRDAGMADDDASDALIADLPNAYIYNVDVVGEGLVARRRSMATLVDHMVPPFRAGGLTEDLARLSGLMNDHSVNESKNPQLAQIYGRQARDLAIELGIAKDLALDPSQDWDDETLHRVEGYVMQLDAQKIPFGMHAFGRTPAADAISSTVEAIVSVDRSALPDQQAILADEMRERILASGPRELDGLIKVLGGQFVPTGNGGEPIRNPGAYATGKNFFGIDPDKVPKPAAWTMGVALAEQMLQNHLEKNGRYPEKVSFVIWGDETMRHEGVLESQVFYLLGTKPVWDARGKLVGVEVIPREELGRPRVDIVIASAAEGMFNNVTRMMDEAVQAAKALDEPDNFVRQHYLATRSALMASGVEAEAADRMAGVRIFDEPPGQFNLNTSNIVANSGSWDTEAGFANDYIRKMGHAYGNGFWGEAMPEVFRMAIANTDTVVHSSSTSLYGALDSDDMFMYMGGLSSAIRGVSGRQPDLLITDTRDPGRPSMTSVDEFIGREFRSRYVNPTWIRGMQSEGYAGAGAMREFVEYLWGWDATVTQTVDDQMWQETFATYVEDKHNLGMKAFFEAKSPYAYQDMTARMIETVRKGYWAADDATRTTLIEAYVDSLDRHGVNCTEVSCGNARLLEYVMQEAAKVGVPASTLAKVKGALETAMGRTIETAAAELRDFAAANDHRESAEQLRTQAASNPAQAPSSRAASGEATSGAAPTASAPPSPQASLNPISQILQGLVMSEEDRSPVLKPAVPDRPSSMPIWAIVWPLVLLLGGLVALRWRTPRMAAT